MSETVEEIDELGVVVDTIEANIGSGSLQVTNFIRDHIIVNDTPEEWQLALQYAKWFLTKIDYATREKLKFKCPTCYKNTGWIQVEEDGGYRPCDACRGHRMDKWQKLVDSDKPPS